MGPLKAIRTKCLDCCGGSHKEVTLCTVGNQCALFPFRFGKNPFRKKRVMTEEQRAEAAARLAKARQKPNPEGQSLETSPTPGAAPDTTAVPLSGPPSGGES